MGSKGLLIVEVTPAEEDPEATLFGHFIALAESVRDGATIQINVVYPAAPQRREQPRLFMAEKEGRG